MPPIYPMCSDKRKAYLDFRANPDKTILLIEDEKSIEDFMLNLLIDNLSMNRKTIVAYPDDEQSFRLFKSLANVGLSKFGMIWTPKHIKEQEPVKRITSFFSAQSPKVNIDRYLAIREEEESLSKTLEDRYSFLQNQIIGTFTWERLFRKWCSLDIGNIGYDPAESALPEGTSLNEYLYTLGEAESSFKKGYTLLHDINPFHDDVYTHFIDTDTLLDELEARKIELDEVVSLIESKMTEIRLEWRKSLIEKIQKGHNLVDQRLIYANDNPLDKSVIIENEDWETNELALRNVQKQLNTFQSESQHAITKKLQRLGAHNIEDEGVSILAEKFDAFVFDLNDSDLFKADYDNNALTILKKLELAQQVSKDLHKAILFCDNHGEYLEWRSSVVHDQRNAVIHDLSYTDVSWKSVVLNGILQRSLESNLDLRILNVAKLNEKLASLGDERKEYQSNVINASMYHYRTQKLVDLKNSNEVLYSHLEGSNTSSEEIFYQLKDDRADVLQQFFPVIFTTHSELSQLKSADIVNDVDDVLIYGSCDMDSLATLRIIDSYDAVKNSIADTYDLRSTCSIRKAEVSSFLDKASHLSDLIINTASAASLFKMKNVSIISCLSPELENLISREFIPQGIKCLHSKAESAHQLMDGLIDEESKVYLLIENGQAGELDVDGVYWNQKVLELLKKEDIEIVDINYIDLFIDRKTVINSIKKTILGGMKHYASSPAHVLFS